jgi:phage-related protein
MMPLNAVIGLINGAVKGINKLGLKIPNWVPVLGGKDFHINIPTMPMLSKGTKSWQGGLAITQERGGEVMDLPRGTRVWPHDESIKMAREEGKRSAKGGLSLTIHKLADKIEVRSDDDLDTLINGLGNKLESIYNNMGKVVPV